MNWQMIIICEIYPKWKYDGAVNTNKESISFGTKLGNNKEIHLAYKIGLYIFVSTEQNENI